MAAPVKPEDLQAPKDTVDDGAQGGLRTFTLQQNPAGLPAFVLEYGLFSLLMDHTCQRLN
jgi:hypothetical protein